MQKNNLKNKNKKNKKLIGRGGSRGKTSGRGHKGQKARAGHKIRPEYRDTIKRIPKLRGRGKNIFQSPKVPVTSVSTDILEKNFKDGELLSPKILAEKGIISKKQERFTRIKFVAGKNPSKKFKILHCGFSKSIAENFEVVSLKK